MPSQLVSSSGCCQPCDSEPVVVNIPGPQGAAGANGTNGTNGIDSFSYTTAQFFVPALGSSVVVPLSGTSFLPESVAGQFFVSIQGVGYMQVTDVTGLNVTLKNPSSGVLGIANAVPTTSIPSGSLVTLAGGVGPQGAAGVSGGAPRLIPMVRDSHLINVSDVVIIAIYNLEFRPASCDVLPSFGIFVGSLEAYGQTRFTILPAFGKSTTFLVSEDRMK